MSLMHFKQNKCKMNHTQTYDSRKAKIQKQNENPKSRKRKTACQEWGKPREIKTWLVTRNNKARKPAGWHSESLLNILKEGKIINKIPFKHECKINTWTH